MRGDASFMVVFQEIFNICMVKELSFTKEDVENLPPFERQGYTEMVQHYYDEMEFQRQEDDKKRKAEEARIKI
jgi:hypothetical protein